MKRAVLTWVLAALSVLSFAQKPAPAGIARPKLVVGIVVDQMRWDFLYRYYDRYEASGGFKRLVNQGFTCENTFIPYAPTITACGHACVYTGSVPAINGITGNGWWDRAEGRSVYCVEDKSVQTVGATGSAGEMSPKNLLATTITDELRLATNFRSKTIGVAIKDRGAILPAGHAANGAFWYDGKSGKWISSTYYGKELPSWVNTFNDKKLPDQYFEKGWNTLYPINTYVQSTADQKEYESRPLGSSAAGFPYELKRFIGNNYGAISSTPYGNTFTLEMAKAALQGEQLGKGNFTDFLAVSLSSPDYIGHSFGPNSIETEDGYLRLDKDLGAFLNHLDQQVGKGQYLVFLTADHGVAHVPGFMKENKLPGGTFDDGAWMRKMNADLNVKFGQDKLILSMYNYQVHLNYALMDSADIDEEDVVKMITRTLRKEEAVANVFETADISETTLNATVKERITNGIFYPRSGDIQFVLKPGYIDGGKTGTTHGLWNPYDAHIPLVFYGWNVKPGKTNRETYMNDIAPTIAAMLRIQMPSGSVGKVITEIGF